MMYLMMPLLEKHGITNFNYYRQYDDNSALRLSTNQAWTENFFKRSYLQLLKVPDAYLNKPVNYYIWLIDDYPNVSLDALNNFNIGNGITIAKRQPDYIEFYGFGSSADNFRIVNQFYLQQIDLLLTYCDFFKENGCALLKKAATHKIMLLNENNKVHIPIAFQQSMKLSKQQYHCAMLLLKGYSAKETADTLNLSKRTVESYLDVLKCKLGCQNKTELIISLNNRMTKNEISPY